MAKTNRFNLHKLLKPIRLVLVGILALVFVVLPSVNSPATTPEAAYISHIKGSELFIGTGTSNSREAAHVSNEVQGNRILYVPGGRRGSAHLSFIHDWPIESAGLVVQAGPDDVASQWSFPCTAGGRFTMNWKKGSDRGCEEGVRLTATEARSQGQADPNGEDFFGSKGVLRTGTGGGFTLGGKEVFTAQAGGEEVIVSPPNSEDVTIQTRSSDTGIEVDTIFSDILVKSAKHPQGRLIPEGQKYSYPQDTTMPIDRNAIINSPEMQDFLNPNNWLFPGLPENVANDLAQQVGEMRTALESVPPSPVAAQPTLSQPTPTSQPQTSSTTDLSQSTVSASTLDFPLYNLVAISTTNNVQPLTFSPDPSLSISSEKLTENPGYQNINFSDLFVEPTNFSSMAFKNENFDEIGINQRLLEETPEISQLPGINLPIPSSPADMIQDAVVSELAKSLAKTIDQEMPINASLQDIYPTSTDSFSVPFSPSESGLKEFLNALKTDNLAVSLPPGDYSIPVHVFCMKSSAHAPTSSETFLLAPLKGKRAEAISALNSRFVATGIDRETIQILSWAIQAGTKYEELPTEQKSIINQLIPEFKEQLSQSFWEKLESTLNQIPGAPSLESVLDRLGPAGELLRTYRQARAAIQEHSNSYSDLESALLLPGQAPGEGDSRYPRGTWSKIGEYFYARLLPTGLDSPASLDIRVLPAR